MQTDMRQPRGLKVIFLTEMWERFSYYGMRALLILFMTAAPAAGGLGFDAVTAGAIYGLYTSMVYMMTLPGVLVRVRYSAIAMPAAMPTGPCALCWSP